MTLINKIYKAKKIWIKYKSKEIIISISLGFIALFSQGVSAQAYVKFNGATALVLVPNLGVELEINPNLSAQVDVLASFWDSVGPDRDPYHINQTFLEGRYYTKNHLQGWFIGPHIGYGMFTIQKTNAFVVYDPYQDPNTYSNTPGSFQSGRASFYGISSGFKKQLNHRWSIEAFIGAGLVQSNYKGYQGFYRIDVSPGDPRVFNKSGEWAIYRGGVMIIYKLFQKLSS